MSIPEFETERLILKGITIQDEPDYKKHFVDWEVVRYLSEQVPWPYPEDGITTYINEQILAHQGKSIWGWGIRLKENPDELIGAVTIFDKSKKEHRGFWLGRKFWGRGIMSEAIVPPTDYAFNVLGYDKMVFTNAVENVGSRKVKEKTGAKFIGYNDVKSVDPSSKKSEVWEMTKEAWNKA